MRREDDRLNHEELVIAIKDLKDALAEMDKKMAPMIDAYQAAIKLGAWAKYFLWFAASAVGLFLALKEVFKK